MRDVYPVKGYGAISTRVEICMRETEETALKLAHQYIEPGSQVWTDENPAYNQFSKMFDHDTVTHAIEFVSVTGVNENQAESYFSRLRRYCLGVAHRIEPMYMMDIALEMAFREDTRRMTDGKRLELLLKGVFDHGKSRWWKGYWQNKRRGEEILFT